MNSLYLRDSIASKRCPEKTHTEVKISGKRCLKAIPDSDIGVGTNCVIYNYTFISKIRRTSCPIHIHQPSMIINQTMIELFDIRYAQYYILDEDVM